MSQATTHTPARTPEDAAAARAVLAHHAQLAEGLDRRADTLLRLVDTDRPIKADLARQDLVNYVRSDIVPHAVAEERALYPAAAARPEGRLLVAGMIAEHHQLLSLIDEVADADSPVRAAAAARGLAVLFAAHLRKENDLVLPLLVATPGVALHEILAGMHDLLGDDHAADGVSGPGESDGCGCGGCGCGAGRGGEEATAHV
jgi:hypothetical protein